MAAASGNRAGNSALSCHISDSDAHKGKDSWRQYICSEINAQPYSFYTI